MGSTDNFKCMFPQKVPLFFSKAYLPRLIDFGDFVGERTHIMYMFDGKVSVRLSPVSHMALMSYP